MSPRAGALDGGVPTGTRMDLVCGPKAGATARAMARGWGHDQDVSDAAVTRLEALVHTAVRHGLRFGPRAVAITVGWIDPSRIRIEVTWTSSPGVAPTSLVNDVPAQTEAILNAFSEEWGFSADRRGPAHWMVLDGR